MSKKEIRVAIFDDNNQDRLELNTKFNIKSKKDKYIEFKTSLFENYEDLIAAIKRGDRFDYIILDVYDDSSSKNVAKYVLDELLVVGWNIPVILYSSVRPLDGKFADFEKMYENYPFILGEKLSKDAPHKVPDKVVDDFISNRNIKVFDLYDDDDIILLAEIKAISRNNLNKIISMISHDKEIKSNISLSRLGSGFSGAQVFKLRYDNYSSILKISKEKDKIIKEIQLAKEYYKKFPSYLRIGIDEKKYENDEVIAFLIDEVQDGLTLFDWLKSNPNFSSIASIFKKLFINSLSDHYEINKGKHENYTTILKKFDNPIKYSQVKTTVKELSPILENHIELDQLELLLTFVKTHEYKSFKKENMLNDKYPTKPQVLCHGDLHLKNIMIQNDSPKLIDTGCMKYDYWCMDYCRLITNIFIEGFDHDGLNYFDIGDIENKIILLQNIIDLKELKIDSLSEKYLPFIHSINWLLNNIQNIYKDYFLIWEYQLGLFKELLQVSYRKSTVSAARRSIALIGAMNCLNTIYNNVIENN